MARLHPLTVPLLFLFLPCVSAQQMANKPEAQPIVEKKAFDLLDSVASRVSSLKNPENRIAMSAAVADLLWTRDEKRSRALFENVTREMVAMAAKIDLSDQQSYSVVAWINNQRQQLVSRIAHHDVDLALTFLHTTRIPNAESGSITYQERNLEFFLARMIAAKDPERAVRLAREKLSQGLSYEVISLLSDLQRSDPKVAQGFYENVVSRLKDEDLLRNQEAANIATNLAISFCPQKPLKTPIRTCLTHWSSSRCQCDLPTA